MELEDLFGEEYCKIGWQWEDSLQPEKGTNPPDDKGKARRKQIKNLVL